MRDLIITTICFLVISPISSNINYYQNDRDNTLKRNLLTNLKHNTYCRLGRSELHGVGVFAIRDIPQDVNPFKIANDIEDVIVDLSEEELETLPKTIQHYIKSFFYKDEEGNYPVLANGLNAINIGFFINHSENPNLEKTENDEAIDLSPDDEYELISVYCTFETTRKVHKGEELTMNYKEIFKDCKQFGIEKELLHNS